MRYEDASLSGSFQDQGPIARDDADQLAAGDRGPATGNLISGAGTETGAAGADSGAGARVTAVSGAGGQDATFSGGQLRVEGEHGSLSVTARGDYVYRPNANVPENSRDAFTYTLADQAGASSQARLTIEIGKTQAVVAANAQRVVPGPDGVVVLPAGVELSDVRIVGRDLLIMLPDGSQMLIVDGAVFVPQLVINDIEVPSTNLAALLIEQEPRPASGVPQSSGGNFITPVGPLDPGTPLGDLLPPTQINYTPPEFNETALEEDRQPEVGANALIQMDDDARPGGNAGGVGDDPDAVNVSGILSGSGGDGPLTFALATTGAPNGFAYVAGQNGSLLVQQNGVTVLTVSLNAQTGAYTVTQNAPIAHAAGENENNVVFTFAYSVTDRDGDSALGSLQINVDDDSPLIASAVGGAGVSIDETSAATPAGFPISATSASAVITGSGLSFGADGQAATGATSYAIAVAGGGATPLRTAQGDLAISLVQTSPSVITGTFVDGGTTRTAFTVTIGADGRVTVQQFVPLEHNVDGSTAAAFNDALDLAGLVNATITVRDADGDTASASTGIGGLIVFRDDGPDSRLNVEAARDTLVLDETQPVGSDTAGAGTPVGIASVTANFADNFAAASFGADGAGSTAYALVLGGSNVASGIFALQVGDRSAEDGDPLGRGAEIVLNQNGNVITGSAGGVNYFTITIDPASGQVTFTQLAAVWNPQGGSSFDEAAILTAAEGALLIRQTVTDSDGDSDSSDLDIGRGTFSIQDDGPLARADLDALAAGTFGPEIGNVLTGAGTSSGTAGADTLGRDGAEVVAVSAGQASDSTFDEAGNLLVQGQYGVLTLRADGSYSYVRNQGTPGGVDDVFTYTLRDTDGDTSQSTLTIRIGDLTPTVNTPALGATGTVVNEAALGERGPNESQGSNEQVVAGANGDTSEATSGTITFTQGDGPAEIRIDGELVTGANQVIQTEKGSIRIDAINAGSISYTYTLRDNLVESGASSTDVIPVSVTDKDGEVASANLTITINDDRPDAINDVDEIAAGSLGPATGNVLSGGDLAGGDSNSLDGVADIQGADGASVVAVSGVTSDSSFDANGNLVVNGQFGVLTLKADGSYSYVRNAGTKGGVDDVFTYTLRDADGDEDTATLTIRIGNLPPSVNAPDAGAQGTIVHEAGLGERGTGESQGSGEEAAAGVDGDSREATSGTITFNQGDGPAEIRIAGELVTGVNQVIDTGEGSLRITGITAGSISYTYTLKDNLLVSGSSSPDVISVSVKDQDGQVATDELVISIVDDAPDARDDVDSVDSTNSAATGNVVTGIDRAVGGDSNVSDGTRDVQGADGAFVAQVSSNNLSGPSVAVASSGVTQIQGQFGTLTINRDGSYSYNRTDLSPMDADEVFTYRLEDNDGDFDLAKLTIQIRDTGVTVSVPAAGGATTTVFEAGLPERGETPGSGEIADGNGLDNDDQSEAVSGFASFTAKDGLSAIIVNGATLNLTQPFAPQTVADDATGKLVITSYSFDQATGQGTIGYSYTLEDNTSGDSSVASFGIVVRDSDGDENSANLVIAIRDDQPDAIADKDFIEGGVYLPATGNVITGVDKAGGDSNSSDGSLDVQGADGAKVVFVRGVTSDGEVNGSGDLVVNGQYGVLTINANGNYSYARNLDSPGGVEDVFTYRLQDGDGDQDEATLTIVISNLPPTVDAPDTGAEGTVVYEKGLGLPDTRPPSDSLGSGEEAAAGDNGDTSESTSGVITYTGGDTPTEIRIADQVVTGTIGQVIDTGEGRLTITSFSKTAIGYTYTLKDNILAAGDEVVDEIQVKVTDKDGEFDTDLLKIVIKDDAPKAADDLDSVGSTEGPATGNVITGVDRIAGDLNTSDGSRDVQGADGAFVAEVRSIDLEGPDVEIASAGNTVIQGKYGTLTISRDGSYSYTRDDDAPLSAEDRFEYVLEDNDGDVSEAVLTIEINDSGVSALIPELGQAGTKVDEQGLPPRGSETPGSGEIADLDPNNNSDGSEATSGSISFNAKDGVGSITVGTGAPLNLAQPFVAQTVVDDAVGKLVITGYSFNPATGLGSLTYSYTLKDNVGNATPSVSFPVEVKDADGDVAGGTLTIEIVDDAPEASDDALGTIAENASITFNAFGNDVFGADGVNTGDVTKVTFTQPAAGGTVSYNAADGKFTFVPASGQSGEVVFTYTIIDGDGDPSTATVTLNISNDSVPSIVSVTPLTLDEDGLPGANVDSNPLQSNPAETDSTESEVMSGTAVVNFSGDVPANPLSAITLLDSDSYDTRLVTLANEPVVFRIESGALVGRAGSFSGAEVIRIAITGAVAGPVVGEIVYTYQAKLSQPVKHTAQGEDSDLLPGVQFRVVDSDGDPAIGSFNVEVVDDVPTAGNDNLGNRPENQSVSFNPFGNDQFGADNVDIGNAANVTVTQPAAGGSVSYNAATNLITFVPAAGQEGAVSFTYTIIDRDGDASTATVTLTLAADSVPTVVVGDLVVDEKGLPASANNSAGSDAAGSSETDSGTMTIATGGDTLTKVEVQGVNGWVDVTNGTLANPALVPGIAGTLSVYKDGSGNYVYSYTLQDNRSHPDDDLPPVDLDGDRGADDQINVENFAVRVSDNDGDVSVPNANSTITVAVNDDGPTLNVVQNSASVVEGQTVNGTWTLTQGADGVTSVLVTYGASSATLQLTPNSSVSLAGPAGTLTVRSDLTYSFAAVLNQDNDADPAPAASFTLTATDGDGDKSSDSLTIAINDGPDAGNATPITLTVNEAALDTNVATGSNKGLPTEVAEGSLSFTAGTDALTTFTFAASSLTSLKANLDNSGTDLFWSLSGDGRTITGALTSGGPAAVTIAIISSPAIAAGQTGLVLVRVTLADNLPSAVVQGISNDELGFVTVQAADHDGGIASGVVNVRVIDDAPVAENDSYEIVEGGPASITFDVDTNDTPGADGTQSRDFQSLVGTYGTLTINGDGTQTYKLTQFGIDTLNGLAPGQTLPDNFSYTLKDGDNDTDPATVVVTLKGADDGVTITNLTPAPQGDTMVDEDDLPAGSDTSNDAPVGLGDFNISAPDGIGNLTVGGVQVFINGVFQANATGTTPLGNTIKFTAFEAATGKVSYEYTLNVRQAHDPIQGDNDLFENLPVALSDKDGSSATGTLVVKIVDDIVDAVNEPARDVVEGATAITGNVITDTEGNGGADVPGADGATLIEVDFGSGFVAISSGTAVAGGFFQFSNADGVYTFNPNGAWTFAPANNLANGTTAYEAGFVYKLRDADGDTDTATQVINVNDGSGPGAGGNVALTLNEAALDLSATGDLAPGTTIGTSPGSTDETQSVPSTALNSLKFTTGSDAITSVAFGTDFSGITVSGLQPGFTLSWSVNGSGQLVGTLFEGLTNLGPAILVQLSGDTGLTAVGDIADVGVTATLVGRLEHLNPNGPQGPVTIGGLPVVASQADGDSNVGTIGITVTDDVPQFVAGNAGISVDEDELAGGITDSDGTGTSGSGSLGGLVNFGADQPGAFKFDVGAGAIAPTLTSAGAAINFTASPDGLTLIAHTGSDSSILANRVFTVTITDPASGAYSFNLLKAIDHLPNSPANSDLQTLGVNLSSLVVAIDSDGDPVRLESGFVVTVEDDIPADFSTQPVTITNIVNAVTRSLDSGDGNIINNFGADGGKVIFASNAITVLTGQGLKYNGVALSYEISPDGQTLRGYVNTNNTAGYQEGADTPVLTIQLQPGGATDSNYQIAFQNPIDQLRDINFNDGSYNFVGGNTPWAGFAAPAAGSQDLLLTPIGPSGVSVNGNANAAGIGGGGAGQNIETGEGIRLDFVIDLGGDPAGTPANYQSNAAQQDHTFGNHYLINNASVRFGDGQNDTTITIRALDSTDTSDIVLGNGTPVSINAVYLSFDGQTREVNISGGLSQTVTVGTVGGLADRSYTVRFVETAAGSGMYTAEVTGVLDSNLRIATQGVTLYDALEIRYVSGDDFDITGFGAAVQSTTPVLFNVPVVIQDNDGDQTASTNIAVTVTAPAAPVTLDLDANGSIAYLGREAGVAYDYDGDGDKEATAWVGAADGILVRDANSNGKVDGASEFVFGSALVTDLAALRAQYGDALNSADADFAKFAVWRDADGDAVSDAGELASLSSLGITSIDLVGDGKVSTAANGDVIVAGSTSYVRNGATHLAQDAIFRIGSVDPVRGNVEAGGVTSAALVAAAAAAAALAAAPAAANPSAAALGARGKGDNRPDHDGSPSNKAVELPEQAASVVDGTPAADRAAPHAADAGPVQRFGGAQGVEFNDGVATAEAAGNTPLDRGTELLAYHAPMFGGGEVHLPGPDQMGMLAGLQQVAQPDKGLEQVLSDALAGGGGLSIDALINAAIDLAGPVQHLAGERGLAIGAGGEAGLASPLSQAVSAWDGGDFTPLFHASQAAMEAQAQHPDAVQPIANG